MEKASAINISSVVCALQNKNCHTDFDKSDSEKLIIPNQVENQQVFCKDKVTNPKKNLNLKSDLSHKSDSKRR